MEDNLKTEVDNAKNIAKIEKRINAIDKKVKNVTLEKKETHRNICDKCGKEFANTNELKEHKIEKHSFLIKCRYCPKTFKQTWQLEMHIQSHVKFCIL